MWRFNFRLLPFVYSLERNGWAFLDILLFLEHISNPLVFFILYSILSGWVTLDDGLSILIRFFASVFVFLSIYEIWYYFNDKNEKREKIQKKSSTTLSNVSGGLFLSPRGLILVLSLSTLPYSHYLLLWVISGIVSLIFFFFHNVIRNTLANFFTFFFLRMVKILPMFLMFYIYFPDISQTIVFICLFPFLFAIINYVLPRLICIADSDRENYAYFQLLLSVWFALIVILYGIWFGIMWVWIYGLFLFLRQSVWFTARKACKDYWKFSRI